MRLAAAWRAWGTLAAAVTAAGATAGTAGGAMGATGREGTAGGATRGAATSAARGAPSCKCEEVGCRCCVRQGALYGRTLCTTGGCVRQGALIYWTRCWAGGWGLDMRRVMPWGGGGELPCSTVQYGTAPLSFEVRRRPPVAPSYGDGGRALRRRRARHWQRGVRRHVPCAVYGKRLRTTGGRVRQEAAYVRQCSTVQHCTAQFCGAPPGVGGRGGR